MQRHCSVWRRDDNGFLQGSAENDLPFRLKFSGKRDLSAVCDQFAAAECFDRERAAEAELRKFERRCEFEFRTIAMRGGGISDERFPQFRFG